MRYGRKGEMSMERFMPGTGRKGEMIIEQFMPDTGRKGETDIEHYMPDTERRGDSSARIDEVGVEEALRIINAEDKKVAFEVEKEIPNIALAVEAAVRAIRRGGRVIYMGCGTSGRLGVLDASECPPTYNVPGDMFTGVIAGGYGALVKSSEGAEDSAETGLEDLKAAGLSAKDLLVGIAASGRTPYVVGGLKYAAGIGAKTACIVCTKNSPMAGASEIVIAVDTGPEVITGSTRMKSGTAQKMVLNMISTGAMIRLGKVYGNLMVDLKPSNLKLAARARRIIAEITGCSDSEAAVALDRAGNNVKVAAVMLTRGMDKSVSEALLNENGGVLKKVIKGGEQA